MNADLELRLQKALGSCTGELQRLTCRWVVDRVESYAGAMHEVLPGIVAEELGAKQKQDFAEVYSALEIMSLSSVGILDMRYEWFEHETDPIEMPVPLHGWEIAEALHSGVMYSPRSGERVLDFHKHIHIAFVVPEPPQPRQAAAAR